MDKNISQATNTTDNNIWLLLYTKYLNASMILSIKKHYFNKNVISVEYHTNNLYKKLVHLNEKTERGMKS